MLGIAVFALSLIGCSHEGEIVGHWQASAPPTGDAKGNDLASGFAKAFANSVTIDFKADHTFSMILLVQIDGTWSMSGNQVTLQPTQAMGEAVDASTQKKPMTLQLSSDGKSLSSVDRDSQFTFRKMVPS